MANKEKNIELKDKLNKIIKQIKAQSTDARFADKLIKELLSVKGQIDVVPLDDTRLNSFVLEYEHNYGSSSIKRGITANSIPTFVFATNGYRVVVCADSMRTADNGRSLYTWLEQICLLQEVEDKGTTLPSKNKELLNAMIYSIDNIANIPLFAFYDDEIALTLIETLNKQLARILEPLVEAQELQKEDANALSEMEQRTEIADMLDKEDSK